MSKRDQVRAMKDKIAAVRARGMRALAAMEKVGRRNVAGLFNKLAEEAGVSQSQLRQAVKFAQTFSVAELEELLRLRTPNGEPLSISLLYRIMFIPQRRQRAMITRLAAAGNWSDREVKSEVQRRFGVDEKARKGGRKPRLPVSTGEALQQLAEKCEQWRRWVECLQAGDTVAQHPSRVKLPRRLNQRIGEVTEAMSKLAAEAAKSNTSNRHGRVRHGR